MAFDRTEYDELQAEQQQKAAVSARDTLQMIRQAGLKAEAVTGDPAWDQYLSYIQAALTASLEAFQSYQQAMNDPRLVNADKIAQIRIAMFRLNGRVEALSWVIGMPRLIKEKGEQAKELLAKLPEIDAGEAA